jgi:hypothetical protein
MSVLMEMQNDQLWTEEGAFPDAPYVPQPVTDQRRCAPEEGAFPNASHVPQPVTDQRRWNRVYITVELILHGENSM